MGEWAYLNRSAVRPLTHLPTHPLAHSPIQAAMGVWVNGPISIDQLFAHSPICPFAHLDCNGRVGVGGRVFGRYLYVPLPASKFRTVWMDRFLVLYGFPLRFFCMRRKIASREKKDFFELPLINCARVFFFLLQKKIMIIICLIILAVVLASVFGGIFGIGW